MSPLLVLYSLAVDLRAAGQELRVTNDFVPERECIEANSTVVEHGVSGEFAGSHGVNDIRAWVTLLVDVRALWQELGYNEAVVGGGLGRGCWWKYMNMTELQKDAEEYVKNFATGARDLLQSTASEMQALQCLANNLMARKLGGGVAPLRGPGSALAAATGLRATSPTSGFALGTDAAEGTPAACLLGAPQLKLGDARPLTPHAAETATGLTSSVQRTPCVPAPDDPGNETGNGGKDAVLQSRQPTSAVCAGEATGATVPRPTVSLAPGLASVTDRNGLPGAVLFLLPAPRRKNLKDNASVSARKARVLELNELELMVKEFLKTDIGWTDLTLNLEGRFMGSPPSQMWFAEGQARLETGEREAVVRTRHPRSRVAKRLALVALAREHFPRELAYYLQLHASEFSFLDLTTLSCGSDHSDAELFGSGANVLTVVLRLLEKSEPAQAPFSWVLETSEAMEGRRGGEGQLQPTPLRYHAALLSKFKSVISERTGGEDEGAVVVLCSVLRAATNRFAGDKGEQLWREYECHTPPPVSTSRELALYMFNAFFGEDSQGGCLQFFAEALPLKDNIILWKGIAKLRVQDRLLPIAEAYASSMQAAIRDVILLSCRNNFPCALHRILLQAETRPTSPLVSAAREVMHKPLFSSTTSLLRKSMEDATTNATEAAFEILQAAVRRKFYDNLEVKARVTEEGGSYTCELLLLSRENEKAMPEILGRAEGTSEGEARGLASIAALKSHHWREYEELMGGGAALLQSD
ncbi:uncharacterized protein Tco025E_03498 [Trypanosoma conorhini]|uniref:Uncharacterized protein n=1 Tax=Trypanosoma conorhini TaxID=83891 RepID=A0A422PW46_9TRYP|nr:uncharacterized protein Tco025E_03498 [Trypanosoma conorhini]RNF21717.1 hypothetical protein Tco025E_03498 [Trypanosoma conorhini]